jgi:hypothetical protein
MLNDAKRNNMPFTQGQVPRQQPATIFKATKRVNMTAQKRLSIGILAPLVSHFDEAMLLHLMRGTRHRCVLITQTHLENIPVLNEHSHIVGRLQSEGVIELIQCDGPVQALDWLFVHLKEHKRVDAPLYRRWQKAAKKFGCLSEADHAAGWRTQVRELIRSFPFYFGTRVIVLQCRQRAKDPYRLMWRRVHYAPTVHPQFYTSPELNRAMFAPWPEYTGRRRYRFSFVGSTTPETRATALRRIRAALERLNSISIHDAYPTDEQANPESTSVVWVEYDHSKGTHGLGALPYVEVLSHTDFCISPMGWGPLWNHRIVEAVMRGAIPITHDEGRHNLGFEHLINCVVARDDDWESAIAAAASMSDDNLVRMRANLAKMVTTRLSPNVAAAALRRELGIPD